MRGEEEILARIRELVSREFDRRVQEVTERLPHRCVHNYSHSLDTRKIVEGGVNRGYNRITVESGDAVTQRIGLCLLGSEKPGEWGGTICDEPIDAKKCPVFYPLKGKDDILPELEADLRDTHWLEKNLPELHALMWVVGYVEVDPPWWKRVIFRFLRLKTQPVLPPIDPSKLLSL